MEVSKCADVCCCPGESQQGRQTTNIQCIVMYTDCSVTQFTRFVCCVKSTFHCATLSASTNASHTTTTATATATLSFCFVGLFVQSWLWIRPCLLTVAQRRTLGIADSSFCTDQMPFQSPSQQCQKPN